MAGNDDLHPLLSRLVESTNEVKEKIIELTSEIQKIQEVLVEGFESIREAIQESIQAQAELKLMEHMMEVEAIEPQIEAEKEQIEIERSELNERLENIDERYERRHDELDQKAAERVRRIGAHIFEIDEEHFEDGIEKPFVEQVTTAWQSFQSHNLGVKEDRTEQITDTTDSAVETIQSFIDNQDSLIEEIDKHRHTRGFLVERTADLISRLQFPYYVVTYEVDGTTHREVVAPSKLNPTDDAAWTSAGLTPLDGANRLLNNVGGVSNGRREHLSSSLATEIMAEYSETSFGLSYSNTFGATLPDTVPVYTEGEAN